MNNEMNSQHTERPNDVTIMYGALGQLGRMANNAVETLGAGVGAKVTGSGSEGDFENGDLVSETCTIERTFTVTGDGPAHEFLAMMEEFENFGPSNGETTVDVRMSGSVPGRPPKITSSGCVIPRGPNPEDIDPADVDHTAVVTVEADITGWLTGPSE